MWEFGACEGALGRDQGWAARIALIVRPRSGRRALQFIARAITRIWANFLTIMSLFYRLKSMIRFTETTRRACHLETIKFMHIIFVHGFCNLWFLQLKSLHTIKKIQIH
jgi:hypothetical protein